MSHENKHIGKSVKLIFWYSFAGLDACPTIFQYSLILFSSDLFPGPQAGDAFFGWLPRLAIIKRDR